METQDTTHNRNTVDVEGTEIVHSPNERLRSSNDSSSSSSSSTRSSQFEDPSQIDPFESGRISSKDDDEDEQETRQEDGESSLQLDPFESGRISSKDHDEYEQETRRSDDESPLQFPPLQTMDRQADEPKYRIPSHVFARNKSGNPLDWSSASNESLFSIQTGNMSFTGDQFNWLMKSDELYRSGEHDLPSTPEIPTPPMHEEEMNEELDPLEPSNPDNAHDHIDNHSPETTEVKINAKDDRRRRGSRASMGEEQATPVSSRSNASGQSFAFPMVEGGIERGGSSRKSGLGSVKEKHESQKKPSSAPNEAHHSTAPEAGNASNCAWFSNCVSCFSHCTKTEKEGNPSKD